jgi:hypothetical protein
MGFSSINLVYMHLCSRRPVSQFSNVVMTYLLHSEHKAWVYLKPSLSERGGRGRSL